MSKMAVVQVQAVSHRHEAIIDWLLANPHVKNLQILCDAFGMSRGWLSVVMRSDAFREEWSRRRAAHNGVLSKNIVQLQLEVVLKALNRLDLAMNDEDCDPHLALAAATKLFAPSPGRAPMIEKETETVREVIISKGVLEKARETIRETTRVPDPYGLPVLPAPSE